MKIGKYCHHRFSNSFLKVDSTSHWWTDILKYGEEMSHKRLLKQGWEDENGVGFNYLHRLDVGTNSMPNTTNNQKLFHTVGNALKTEVKGIWDYLQKLVDKNPSFAGASKVNMYVFGMYPYLFKQWCNFAAAMFTEYQSDDGDNRLATDSRDNMLSHRQRWFNRYKQVNIDKNEFVKLFNLQSLTTWIPKKNNPTSYKDFTWNSLMPFYLQTPYYRVVETSNGMQCLWDSNYSGNLLVENTRANLDLETINIPKRYNYDKDAQFQDTAVFPLIRSQVGNPDSEERKHNLSFWRYIFNQKPEDLRTQFQNRLLKGKCCNGNDYDFYLNIYGRKVPQLVPEIYATRSLVPKPVLSETDLFDALSRDLGNGKVKAAFQGWLSQQKTVLQQVVSGTLTTLPQVAATTGNPLVQGAATIISELGKFVLDSELLRQIQHYTHYQISKKTPYLTLTRWRFDSMMSPYVYVLIATDVPIALKTLFIDAPAWSQPIAWNVINPSGTSGQDSLYEASYAAAAVKAASVAASKRQKINTISTIAAGAAGAMLGILLKPRKRK